MISNRALNPGASLGAVGLEYPKARRENSDGSKGMREGVTFFLWEAVDGNQC